MIKIRCPNCLEICEYAPTLKLQFRLNDDEIINCLRCSCGIDTGICMRLEVSDINGFRDFPLIQLRGISYPVYGYDDSNMRLFLGNPIIP